VAQQGEKREKTKSMERYRETAALPQKPLLHIGLSPAPTPTPPTPTPPTQFAPLTDNAPRMNLGKRKRLPTKKNYSNVIFSFSLFPVLY